MENKLDTKYTYTEKRTPDPDLVMAYLRPVKEMKM